MAARRPGAECLDYVAAPRAFCVRIGGCAGREETNAFNAPDLLQIVVDVRSGSLQAGNLDGGQAVLLSSAD
jgi:hypothetical protein